MKMKRKFLSLVLCLMVCLSSMLVLSACGEEKPTPVAEAEAVQALGVAMAKMETETVVKMSSPNFMFMGEFLLIASEDYSYTKMDITSMESWSKKEGDQWWEYTIVDVGEDEPSYQYVKKLIPQEQNALMHESMDLFEQFEGAVFASASKLNGELTISYSMVEDDVTVVLTIKIVNDTISSISISSMGISMKVNFEFGEHLLQQIPEIPETLPNDAVWDVYNSYIEVPNMPTTFTVGDTLDLTNVAVEFYEDDTSSWAEEFPLTMDMITGFDTTTATEEGQPRTMIITFCGLTYNVEYTVTEATVE